MKTNKPVVAAVLVATIAALIGLIAAAGVLIGDRDAVAMNQYSSRAGRRCPGDAQANSALG